MPATQWTDPGAYNRKITIQQESPVTSDAYGTPQTSWQTVVVTWAAFTAKTYQSTTMDAQILVRRQAQFRMRRLPSTPVQIGMRVVDTTTADVSQTWVIVDVQDVAGAQRELILICQYVLPDQGV